MPVDGQLPVGEQVFLVNLDPRHDQLVLLWRKTAGQQPAIADGIDPHLSLILCVDMRFVMTIIVMEENGKTERTGIIQYLDNLAATTA